jgi:hypothetical protein
MRLIEECRRSCRDVDNGETAEMLRRVATLPNLGMWMKSPKLGRRWITGPPSIPGIPSAVENRGPYPRLVPGSPSVRTPRCPHYAHLIHTLRKVIHNSTVISGKRCTYTPERSIDPMRRPGIGENRGKMWIVYEHTVGSYLGPAGKIGRSCGRSTSPV